MELSSSSLSTPQEEHQLVQLSPNFPRFFIIRRTDSISDSSFKKTSPFLIEKTFRSVLGDLRSLKKLQSGDLLVEVSSANQSEILSNCSTIGTFAVSVQPHRTLNISRGVISETDLLYSTKDEIIENLKDQNVIDARRITIHRNSQTLNTKHIILTFNNPKLPQRIKVAYLSCPVRPYIPNPLRCFQCQRYGHGKASCRGSVTCAQCAQVGHDSSNCTNASRCVNCKGDHPAFSRTCPKWILEKEIQTVKVTNNISYLEARRQVESRTPSVGVLYSQTLKPLTKSVDASTQTSDNSTAISKKVTHNKSTSTTVKVTPKLECLTPTTEPTIIEYSPSFKKQSNKLSNPSSSSQSMPSTSNTSSVQSPVYQPTKQCLPKPKTKSPGTSEIKNTKKKRIKTTPLGPPFVKKIDKFKKSKRMIQYADEEMESENYSQESSFSDNDENTVYDEIEPT